MRIEDKEIVRDAMRAAREQKEELWRKPGPSRDIASQFAIMANGVYEIPPPMLDAAHQTFGSMAETLEWLLFTPASDGETLMEAVQGEISSCLLFFEAYHKKVPIGLSGETDDITELENEYRNDPASNVKEALIVLGAFPDMVGGCEMFQMINTYSVGDGGILKWDDPVEVEDQDIQGNSPSIMRQVIKGRVR